jgi:D-amino peptidase
MVGEVNAAIEGAFAGGATEVLVCDGHGHMRNLDLSALDERARLVTGSPKQAIMMTGLNETYAGVFLIGYHARAGSYGVLAHTINGGAFRKIILNKQELGEAGLNAAYAAHWGVPVLLVSGDDCLAQEVRQILPWTGCAVVKRALSARAADCLSPGLARQEIREQAHLAVSRIGAGSLFALAHPLELCVQMASPILADIAENIPTLRREAPDTVVCQADDLPSVMRVLFVLSATALQAQR